MDPLSRRLPHGAWGRNYLHNVSLDPIGRYLDNVSVFTGLNKTSLYTVRLQRSTSRTRSHLNAYFHELSGNVRSRRQP